MTNIIGLVCEGPRDVELISSVISNLFPDKQIEYRYLQPDVSLKSSNYNGWKGVLRWCRKDYGLISESKEFLNVGLDLIIIQIDGDVSRDYNNKQSHCNCIEFDCAERNSLNTTGTVWGEECSRKAAECPIEFPCTEHQEERPDAFIAHLTKLLNTYLGEERPIPTIITIPCDSTDTWVLAAFEDEKMEYELLENPWDSRISKGKEFHGVRIPGRKKNKKVYRELIKTVIKNWPMVVAKCKQAGQFQEKITEAIESI